MRPLSLLLLLCLSSAAARAAGAEFVRIWPAWRDAEHFDRISEYFYHEEGRSRVAAMRSNRQVREGYYFSIQVKSDAVISGGRLVLEIIRPDHPEVKTFSFPANLPARETALLLGLTGADWPGGSKASPVAWKLTLRGADGTILAEHKSFLWEKPAK